MGSDMEPPEALVDVLNVVYPLFIFSLFVLAPLIRLCLPAGKFFPSYHVAPTHRSRLQWASPLLSAAFIVQGVLYHVQSRLNRSYSPPPWSTEYVLGSAFLWACLSIALIESASPFWPAYTGAWAIAGLSDGLQLSLSTGAPLRSIGGFQIARASIQLFRVCIFAIAFVYSICTTRPGSTRERTTHDEETRSLLDDRASSIRSIQSDGQTTASYGSLNGEADDTSKGDRGSVKTGEEEDDDDDENEDEQEIKRLQQERVEKQGWFGYLKGFAIFLPHILPYKDRTTQLWFLVMIVCIAADRVLVLLIPRQLGIVIGALTQSAGTGVFPWKELITWFLLKFPLEILLNAAETFARTRVSQYAEYQLNSLAFTHVMSLSMDYHTSKSTGKVITAIEQGTDLTYLVDTLFEVGPMIIDLLVAVIYLTQYFDFTVGFIVLVSAACSAYVTLKGNKYTSKLERQFVENGQAQNTVLYDSISNWYTVAIHNRAKYEHKRFGSAVWKSLMSNRRYYDASEGLWMVQEIILDFGLYAGCYVAAMRVVDGTSAISSFVFLTSYWDSITSPMESLAHQFHQTAAHLINAEWLYQLLQTKPSVQEKIDATRLDVRDGRVTFDNVTFSYGQDRQILKGISFTTEPGQSIALVGETGSGKSTILKLLWRFYDVTGGKICIDGQDVRDITLDSLRDSLGSVPQDPSVFDQTIMQNLLYARPFATEQDVYEACRAACIHDQIVSFPDGYQSKIGERGVRLSGGELQRLAIARVMIRKPKIVVLDEATSAVDSDTEANVQRAIKALSAGRTVFTVAHRLSTVVAADKILVVHKGEIVEQGTHQELLAVNGRYARLWAIQTASHDGDLLIDDAVSD